MKVDECPNRYQDTAPDRIATISRFSKEKFNMDKLHFCHDMTEIHGRSSICRCFYYFSRLKSWSLVYYVHQEFA